MDNSKAKKQASRTILVWILLLLIVVAGGTYAWFTFQSLVNVTPDTAGAIAEDEGSLLISASPDGPFSDSCKLMNDIGGELYPVSTDDLNDYFKATSQNADGISILFKDVTDSIPEYTLHGKIYLKADKSAQNIYLYKQRLNFGEDTQAIAAMRLGMRIKSNGVTKSYIFNLDDMKDTSGAEKRVTTAEENSVIASISKGAPKYVKDASLSIDSYTAIGKNASDDNPTEGEKSLFSIDSGAIAEVEYWLYLEGCDENCINSVQKKDVELALSFAGFAR